MAISQFSTDRFFLPWETFQLAIGSLVQAAREVVESLVVFESWTNSFGFG